MKTLFFMSVMTLSVNAFAYTPQEGNVTALVGPLFFKTNYWGSSSGAPSPITQGLGVIAFGDLNKSSAIEIGMFEMNKYFYRKEEGLAILERKEVIHITMGYRYWFNKFFSASTSFYSSYSMGDPEIIFSDYPRGQEIDTSARDVTEYGFDFSLQTEIWSNGRFGAVLDGRYSWSVTGKHNEKSDHFGMFAGLTYLIQEKFPTSKTSKK